MADRYDDRYPGDRNVFERAGDEVRSWFRDRDRDRYQSMHGYGYSRERDWTPERWEGSDRWSGERPADFGPTAVSSRAWHERDDRFLAPADYRDWSRQGWGYTNARPDQSRGIYEDDRGRVTEFDHGSMDFRGRGPKGYRRSDDRIREDVCERLTDSWRVDASDIEVVVNNGEVTLSGVVNSRGEKRLAEDLAEEISGVRDVHNDLHVNTSRT